MYIAAKYEEVCTPAVHDFAAVSDNAFTIGDVKKMEQSMLLTLNFDLAFPPAVFFLRRFSKAASVILNSNFVSIKFNCSLFDFVFVNFLVFLYLPNYLFLGNDGHSFHGKVYHGAQSY